MGEGFAWPRVCVVVSSCLCAVLLPPRIAGAEGARLLTLAEVEQAAREQPQMIVAGAAVSAAEGEADQTRAPLLPQLTALAQYTRGTGNFTPRLSSRNKTIVGTDLSPAFDYWQFVVGATQLVYDFGQTIQRYRAAQKTVDAQKFAAQTTQLQVTLAVRLAYFNARAMKQIVGVARETLDDQNRHLVQVEGFIHVGTQPAIALAQQRASVSNAEVLLVTAQNSYETAKAQLNDAAGLTQGTDYEVADETLAPVVDEDQPIQTLAAMALAARPEIAMLDKQRQAQEATISSVKGGYGPTLSATAGAAEIGLALGSMVTNWYGGVTLNWPIFQGGLTMAQVRTAEAGLQTVSAQKLSEQLQVRLQVDSARLAVRAAKATIPAADNALTSTREQLALAEERYATGVGNIIELNDAQVAYTSAAAQAVQARYVLDSARAQLLAALGRT
jgi:outer membrane protein